MKKLSNFSRKPTSPGFARPLVLMVLAAFSIFFSLVFIFSSNASSEKFFRGFPSFKSEKPVVSETVGMLSSYSDVQPDVKRLSFKLGSDDSFYSVMTSLGVHGSEISKIVKKTRPVYDLRRLKRGTTLKVTTVEGGWSRVEYQIDDFDVLVIDKETAGPEAPAEVIAKMTQLPYKVKEKLVSGTIESSLFEAGIKAGANANILMELSDIFAWDIDFASDIRKGDRFSILYEVIEVNGKAIRSGRILGAEMDNNGRNFQAIYYDGGETSSGYYDADGKSLRRTLLKSPLRYRRISSYFTKRRYHPILKRYRPHHGVDYAAPTGTPVEAAGSGRVIYAGWKGGYGKYIKIKHNNSYSTAYGHLSRLKPGLRKGSRVKQGDVIGYVGSTGVSTGPHLHYEVWRGRNLVNPLGLKSSPVGSIPEKEFALFAAVRDRLSERLSGEGTAFAVNDDVEIDREGNILNREQISMRKAD